MYLYDYLPNFRSIIRFFVYIFVVYSFRRCINVRRHNSVRGRFVYPRKTPAARNTQVSTRKYKISFQTYFSHLS